MAGISVKEEDVEDESMLLECNDDGEAGGFGTLLARRDFLSSFRDRGNPADGGLQN